MKRILAILLCCIFLISFAACGGKTTTDTPTTPDSNTTTPGSATPSTQNSNTSNAPATPAAPKRDTVYLGIDGDTGSLDPFVVSGSFLSVLNAYTEPLWICDGTGEGFASRYFLAESVDTISDLEYVIHLRKGVTFSNGNPFTAEDVLFTLDYVRNKSTRAYYIAAVDLEKTRAEDDYTVRLFLSFFDKTQMPSLSGIYMLDAESYNPDTNGQNPIGTGPYIVKNYVVNSSLTLVARDDYWGGAPAIKNVVFKNIAESSQKVTAIETGEVDMLFSCPVSDVDYIDSLDDVSVIKRTGLNNVCLTYNAGKNSPLATKEARWAVSYAVNRQGVIDVALHGLGTIARAPFSVAAVDYYEGLANLHDTYKTGYNLELAKKYAEESGLVGKTVRIVTNGSDVYATTAQIIEQALKEIGVNAQVVNYDQATVRNLIAGEADWEVYVAFISNPSGTGSDMIYAQAGKFNRCHIDYDTELTKKVNEGLKLLATSDLATYKSLLHDYLAMYEDYCFVYGIADTATVTAATDSLKGLLTAGYGYDRVGDFYFAD